MADRSPSSLPPYSASRPLRLGTRGSALALAQARLVRDALCRTHGLPPDSVAILPVKTKGDLVQDRPLAEIGGKALWTKELDRALIRNEIDLAVHSMKDVETWLPDEIVIAAVLPRADPRDRLIGAASLADLPHGARVGTSSPRRAAMAKNRRPDLVLVNLRGNVETRLRKVAAGEVAATFLAAAGLDRLGIAAGQPLPLAEWLPASAQGIIGITCRAGDSALRSVLAAISDADTRAALDAERGVLEGLGGDCHTSVAVHAWPGPRLRLRAELLSLDGSERVVAEAEGPDPRLLGLSVARDLLDRASPGLRAALRPAG